MSKIEQIQAAIESLSEEEYARLRRWFSERDGERWDRQIEADAEKGKLDFVVKEAHDEKWEGEMGRTIRTQVMEQLEKLPKNQQQQVLEFVRGLTAPAQDGVPGSALLEFAGAIPADDLKLMLEAIEEGCERVNADEW